MHEFEIARTVEALRFGATDSKPQDADWDRLFRQERFQFWEPVEVTYTEYSVDDDDEETEVEHTHHVISMGGWNCAVVVDGEAYHEWDEDLPISEEVFAGLMDEATYADGPMMNYWYPTPSFDVSEASDMAAKIAETCLVVVQVDDEVGLALAGGGMDLSWSICAAFVKLGLLPPTHFADLPRMAEPWSDSKEIVYRAMKRSLEAQRDQVGWSLERLDDIRAWTGWTKRTG